MSLGESLHSLAPAPSHTHPPSLFSAYIKSVLCPSLALPRGPDSAGPGTPLSTSTAVGGGSAAAARVLSWHHRRSSSVGSSLGLRSPDAEYMAELDRVSVRAAWIVV